MTNEITDRQQQVLDFVQWFVQQRGMPPTVREIAKGLPTSRSNAHYILHRLAEKGILKPFEHRSRGIELAGMRPTVRVPILGRVAAGKPDMAEERREATVPVDAALLKGRKGYALRVVGDSMIGEHIREGDLLIVREQPTAKDGDIVIALLDGENTVKKLRRRGRRVELLPANRRYKPITVRTNQELRIQGKVVQVQRTL